MSGLGYGVIWTPQAGLQALFRHEPGMRFHPVALMSDESRQARVLEVNAAAAAEGVAAGVTAAQALARCSGVHVRHRNLEQETALREIIHAAALAFSPVVEMTSPGAWTMDIRRLGRDQEKEIRGRVLGQLAALELDVRLGLAPTPQLAWYAARAAEPVLEVDAADAFHAALPLAWAEPSAGMAEILEQWGIRTMGALTTIARAEISLRLGPDGAALWDRAAAREIRPLKQAGEAVRYEETVEFENEIRMLEPLLARLAEVLHRILVRLGLTHHVAAELDLILVLEKGENHRHSFRIPEPTDEAGVLLRMMQTHLEGVRTTAPVVGLHLRAVPARPGLEQEGLFETGLRDPQRWTETAARLAAVAGPDRTGRPERSDTHRPDTFVLRPVQVRREIETTRLREEPGLPLRRFRPRRPARIKISEGRLFAVEAEGVAGRVRECRGPWRVSGAWWRQGEAWETEEWDVDLEPGGLYRVACSNGRWWLEGTYG
jgi:protein ImuB